MKRLSSIFTAGLILFFSSCNDSSKDKEETKASDTVAVVPPTPAPVAEPVFTPFKILVVKHKVKDFDKWRAGYMAHDSMRQAYGITHFRLGRGSADSNIVIVTDKINDVQKAKEFAASAGLKDAMQKAGVVGKPEIGYFEMVRFDSSKLDYSDRIMVTHKVKDYDAWLKVFDAEGKAKRAEYGLVDRALSRGIDDPNTVRIVFAVSDMAKAKARASSEELKKLMTDAGVEGKPDMIWYKLVD